MYININSEIELKIVKTYVVIVEILLKEVLHLTVILKEAGIKLPFRLNDNIIIWNDDLG